MLKTYEINPDLRQLRANGWVQMGVQTQVEIEKEHYRHDGSNRKRLHS